MKSKNDVLSKLHMLEYLLRKKVNINELVYSSNLFSKAAVNIIEKESQIYFALAIKKQYKKLTNVTCLRFLL